MHLILRDLSNNCGEAKFAYKLEDSLYSLLKLVELLISIFLFIKVIIALVKGFKVASYYLIELYIVERIEVIHYLFFKERI